MANVYLHQRNDKRMYVNCYRRLADVNPTVHTCLLLGDAYMRIQEPEKAIKVYQTAWEQNPRYVSYIYEYIDVRDSGIYSK